MKRIMTAIALVLVTGAINAQTPKDVKYVFTEASELNLIGKIHKDTPNPYHRVDTVKYKGFTGKENYQVRCPAGTAVLFKTNSTTLSVKTVFGKDSWESTTTMPLAYRGYDLYIKDNGQWRWAAAAATSPKNQDRNLVLINNMNGKEKECLLYLRQLAVLVEIMHRHLVLCRQIRSVTHSVVLDAFLAKLLYLG